MHNTYRLLFLSSIALLAACSQDNDPQPSEPPLAVSDPNDFLRFLNPQASLPVGDYTIVLATATAAQTGPYTLTITYDDGSTRRVAGAWTSSGGQSSTAAGNPTVSLEMRRAGGVTLELSASGTDPYLYLLNNNDTSKIVAQDDNSGGGTAARIFLPASAIGDESYAQAYYAMIDTANERDTLAKWQAKNGFGNNDALHAIFRDVRDLGYGRDMYFRRDATSGDVAAYVRNFQVRSIAGLDYTTLNLDAAVAGDTRHHVGTNAIEYSAGPSGQKIVKFYTFSPTGQRLNMVDIDGRGPKAMPGPCIACHGGRADPMQQNAVGAWVFPRQGNTFGRMQGLEVGVLDFADVSPWTRAEQEATLRQMNEMVLCSYPLSAASTLTEDACRSLPTIGGEWSGNAGAEVIKAWYGGMFNPAPTTGTNMPNATFDDTYVPTGWMPNGGSIPPGADTLYRDVFANSCRACHVLRGTVYQWDVDFASYDTVFGATSNYNARIRKHVFERGRMPLSLLVYEAFWGDGNGPGTRPSALATWLASTGQTPPLDASGNPRQPGAPVADAGPDRTTTTPVKLSGAASRFATSYRWSIVGGPPGASPTLTNADTSRPTLADTIEGATYVLQLIVGNGSAQSTPDQVTITAKNTGWGLGTLPEPEPRNIRFSHIRTILQSSGAPGPYGASAGAGCFGCHTGSGMPVYYDNRDRVGNGCDPATTCATDPANLHQFYLDIRARVNFADPADSLILRKPSGFHHGGGQPTGFGGTDLTYYNIFLEWIMNGAPE